MLAGGGTHGKRALVMNPLADFTVQSVDGVAVADVSGEIDASNAGDIGARISALAEDEGRGLALDLTAVDYLDSSGLQMLLRLASTFADRGRELRVVIAEGSFISSLMETTGVERILSLGASREDAVRELAAQG